MIDFRLASIKLSQVGRARFGPGLKTLEAGGDPFRTEIRVLADAMGLRVRLARWGFSGDADSEHKADQKQLHVS